MASFETLPSGKVRVYLSVKGKRKTAVLPNKNKARSWAREKAFELNQSVNPITNDRTLKELFQRYSDEVSINKRGARWETVRLKAFRKHYRVLCAIKLANLKREDFEAWIAQRSKHVKASTINRELNLISHCLTQARRWHWITHNPFTDLQRPKNPPHRNRRITQVDIDMICHAAGFEIGQPLTRKSHFVAVAFLFAIETAMRCGEICGLDNESIDRDKQVAHLTQTKNGDKRDVPLSDRAMALLKLLPEPEHDQAPLFQLTPDSLDVNFRKIKNKTLVEDLHFHDTRHEATTRLALLPEMSVLRLAKITGHRDVKYLMIYFNEKAEDMVAMLNAQHQSAITGGIPQGADTTALLQQLAQELLAQSAQKAAG